MMRAMHYEEKSKMLPYNNIFSCKTSDFEGRLVLRSKRGNVTEAKSAATKYSANKFSNFTL